MIEYPKTARRQSRKYLSRSCISKDFKKKTSVGQKIRPVINIITQN